VLNYLASSDAPIVKRRLVSKDNKTLTLKQNALIRTRRRRKKGMTMMMKEKLNKPEWKDVNKV
jgi:hypothetical protein